MSNVVVSLTIHDDTYFYVYTFKRCSKHMKPLWKVEGFFNRTSWKVSDVQIVHFTWVFVSVSVSLCVSVCCVLCVVVVVVVVVIMVVEEGGREEKGRD